MLLEPGKCHFRERENSFSIGKETLILSLQGLNKAESHAVLAAHRLRLKKYYEGEALEKIFKGSIKIPEINHQQNTTESSHRGPYLSVKKPTEEGEHHHKDREEGEKKEKIGYWDEVPKGEKGNNVEKRSLIEEIREIKKIKDNAPGFPVVGSWNKKGGKEPCWKDGIERYIPEKMLTIEELMDLEKSKKYNEIYKKGRRFLSDEEKLIQELEKYKGDKKKKKDLRTRVEGYLKESGKVVDEFLENEYIENDKRHDKRHMFDELMKEVYNHGLSVGKI